MLALTCCRHAADTQRGALHEYAFVANRRGNSASAIDLNSFQVRKTIAVGKEPVALIASPKRNEVYVVNSGSGTLSIIDAESLTVSATVAVGSSPSTVSLSADANSAYITSTNANTLAMLDLASRRIVKTVRTGIEPGSAEFVSPRKLLVVANRGSDSVWIYDSNGTKLGEVAVGSHPGPLVALPDGSQAFVANTASNTVSAIDLRALKVIAELQTGAAPAALILKPDGGELLVLNNAADSIAIINTKADEIADTVMAGSQPQHGAISQSGTTFYFSNSGSNTVSMLDVYSRHVLAGPISVGASPGAVALTPDERYVLAVDSASNDVAVIDAAKRSLLTLLPVGPEPVAIVTKSFRK